MAMQSKSDILSQLQLCSSRYYQPVLKSWGYVDLFNNYVDWYKSEGDILKHIHLCAQNRQSPTVLTIYYGVHPFFLDAPLPPTSIFCHKMSYSEEVMHRYHVKGSRIVRPDLQYLEVPVSASCGAEQLSSELLPLLHNVRDVISAYQLHKKENRRRYLSSPFSLTPEQAARLYSLDFIDEAIFNEDESVNSLCLLRANELLSVQKQLSRPSAQIIKRIECQLSALQTHGYSDYQKKLREKNTVNAEWFMRAIEGRFQCH